jgi:hypothetical protein
MLGNPDEYNIAGTLAEIPQTGEFASLTPSERSRTSVEGIYGQESTAAADRRCRAAIVYRPSWEQARKVRVQRPSSFGMCRTSSPGTTPISSHPANLLTVRFFVEIKDGAPSDWECTLKHFREIPETSGALLPLYGVEDRQSKIKNKQGKIRPQKNGTQFLRKS